MKNAFGEPGNTAMHAYEFMLEGETGAEIAGHVVTLHFIDGQRGDDDLDGGNGVIVDDGGPSAPASPAIPVLSKAGIVVFMILLSVLACLMMRREKKQA